MLPRTIARPIWFAALGAAAWANRDNLGRWTRSLQHAIDRRRHPPPPQSAPSPFVSIEPDALHHVSSK